MSVTFLRNIKTDEVVRWGRGKQKDVVLEITGSWGKYHMFIVTLLFVCKIPIAWNQLAIVFYTTPIKYDCGGEAGGGGGDALRRKEEVEPQCPCPNPVYDKSVFSNNMIMEFNLICSRKSWASITQSIFQGGTLVGSMGFGMLADMYGRKNPMLASCVLQLVIGVVGVYVKNLYLFIACRFLMGISVGGLMIITFVIIMEFIGPEHREVISALFQIPFNIGAISLSLISYMNRDWRDFQMFISAPCIFYVVYFFTIPETPRWLILKGRTDEAIKILTTCAKWNGRPTANIKSQIEAFHAAASRNTLKKGSTADLFKTPNIRRNILAMGWNWCVCSFCFYGVSQYLSHLGGNIFINFAISSSVVTCGTLFSIVLMAIMGRVSIIKICHALCSVCLIALIFFNEGYLAIALASCGTLSSFIVFVVVYLHASELFPTVVRNAAVGFSSMCARIGSIIAPFVIELDYFATFLPALIFATTPFIAFFVTMLLPETKGCELMTTIEEAENFGEKSKKRESK